MRSVGAKFVSWIIAGLVIGTAATLPSTPAMAQQPQCQLRSSNLFRYQGDTVEHAMIAPGPQGCFRVFRMLGRATIEGVALVSPARNGRATVQGLGYSYTPRSGGEDSFDLRVTGTTGAGTKGFSIIRVRVLAR